MAAFLLSSCNLFYRHGEEVVAVLGEHQLLRSELDDVTRGLTGDDSASVADQYIHQWAGDILIYEHARDKADERLEALVENYRRSLYVHRYQQRYIAQRMPTLVADTLIQRFYAEHCDELVLDQTILQGLIIVVPNASPNLSSLRSWVKEPDTHLEQIEKYAYGNASSYELFLDRWMTIDQVLLRFPFSENNLRQQLRQQRHIELQDSVSTYMLQVTDRYFSGEAMPEDYARTEIEKMILSQRQVDYLQRQRESLIHDALLLNKLRIYEQ